MQIISTFGLSHLRHLPAAVFAILIFSPSVVGQSPRRQPTPATNRLTTKTSETSRVITEANTSALNMKSDYQRGLLLDEIGAAQAKAGLFDAAVLTATRAYPHTMSTMRAIGEQLGDSNDLVKAKAIATRLKGGGSSTAFAFFARRQAEKGRIAEALLTTKYIQAPEVRRTALEWIAEQQAANFDFVAARKTLVLARMTYPSGHSNPDDIDAIIAATHLIRGDVRAAQKIINSIKSLEMRFGVMISGAEILFKKGDKAAASSWLESAFRILPAGSSNDFWRYVAIPIQVKLDAKELAMKAAEGLSPDLREKGYMAIAVVCAEAKDVACVKGALAKLQWAAMVDQGQDFSDFGVKLAILNVTAALIDNDQFEPASGLLTSLERDLDGESVRMSIAPKAQLHRVFILARQNLFEEARSLAQEIRTNSTSDDERGTALRVIALLETKKAGAASSRLWVSALIDPEDRAYALLGVAQGLLEYNDPKLHYSVIQIH